MSNNENLENIIKELKKEMPIEDYTLLGKALEDLANLSGRYPKIRKMIWAHIFSEFDVLIDR